MKPTTILQRCALALLLGLAACTTTATETGDPGSVELPEQEQLPATGAPERASAGEANGDGDAKATELAAPQYRLPAWSREDVQPQSARFGERYGLEAYAGKTVIVVLLEGYCPYCQSNSKVAQTLQEQLVKEGLDVQTVILGDRNGERFAPLVGLPIFRDEDGAAWDAMRPGASKHDTFVFGPDGKRSFFWLGSYQGDASRWTVEVGDAARAVAKPAR